MDDRHLPLAAGTEPGLQVGSSPLTSGVRAGVKLFRQVSGMIGARDLAAGRRLVPLSVDECRMTS
jgi:hypothetical protein